MTLEKAIKTYTSNAEYERTHENLQGCHDFSQLAEWLKELKRYRETDTVCIDGILYQSKHPTIKTIHSKTGEVVIGGFKEVKSRCRRLKVEE